MAQQNGKRKHSEDLTPAQRELPSPIIFLARGVKADTRFTVFRQEFHLHSSGLKHHSNYFRTFLDSADKQPAPPCALFKYDYRSVIDEDGSWALMPVSDSPEITDQQLTLVNEPEEEIEVLRRLLCAINSKKYRIKTADELKRPTRLADYYCALPVVSATLTEALFKSSMFDAIGTSYFSRACECHDDCVSLLVLARKLRHGVLFRECLIYTVGKWDSLPDPEKDIIKEDQELYKLVQAKLSVLYELLAKTQGALLWAICEKTIDLNKIVECNHSKGSIGATICMYEAISDEPSLQDLFTGGGELGELILSLLKKNHHALGCTYEHSGHGIFENTYLCTEIEDDEFPWDLEEIDW
ncbi:uncharacterized protein EAF02_008766 [Botrytis sinoallii]|uniref:uncharacterized protein n=1 Tax=Botrytis sinoallii TaxID=1463999 RepID=UPI001901D512|nr:uncharacterized protein EAF02_008766 [Botrytis sinoallii]KAF7872695.1 hypothetical protein EAF02_008766 [Botrytis sinoallii]